MAIKHVARRWIKAAFARAGYTINRRLPGDRPIDVFGLVVREEAARRNDFTVIQVGANDGISHDPLNHYIKQYGWRALLVEPIPSVFSRLTETYSGFEKVRLENCAISAVGGTVEMYSVRDDPSLPRYVKELASLDRRVLLTQKPAVPDIEDFIEVLTVPALTFQQLLDKHELDTVHLVQIDTEGFDFEVLKMVMETSCRPSIIQFESVHLGPLEIRECAALLARNGYRYLTVGIDTIAVRDSDVPGGLRAVDDVRHKAAYRRSSFRVTSEEMVR